MDLTQVLHAALVPATTKTLSEIVRSMSGEVKQQGATDEILADMF